MTKATTAQHDQSDVKDGLLCPSCGSREHEEFGWNGAWGKAALWTCPCGCEWDGTGKVRKEGE